jgi:hypothetical protein
LFGTRQAYVLTGTGLRGPARTDPVPDPELTSDALRAIALDRGWPYREHDRALPGPLSRMALAERGVTRTG